VRRGARLAAVALLGALALGCGRNGPPYDHAILILLDTARADRMSVYGHDRPTTPALERLARRGVVFDQAVSAAPWTLPSMASILGAAPAHEVFDRRLLRSETQSLQNAGFRTAAFTEGGYLSSFYGFALGFDEYHEQEGFEGLEAGDDENSGIAHTFRLAREWIDAHRDERFFVLIHTYEPHMPYRRRTFAEGMDPGRFGPTFENDDYRAIREGRRVPTDVELAYLAALYDGGLLEADRHVGALVDHLAASGLLDDSLVVVTSDHGEELGEHWRSRAGDHGHSLRDDLLRVPLVIAPTAGDFAGRRVPDQVSTVDVMPTVLELLGVTPHPRSRGRSLAPLLRGERLEPRPAFATSPHSGPDRAALRFAGFKLIETVGPVVGKDPLRPLPPPVQLYDLAEDPGEQHNLADERPQLVERFHRVRTEDGAANAITLDGGEDETLHDRLKALGYLR
jgi:arylsulfatase A-like enzyme